MKALQCQAEDEGLALQAVGAPEGIQAGKWPGKNPCAAVREGTEGHRGHEAAV